MSGKSRQLLPKPPAIHPNPTLMSIVGRNNRYQAPNASTVDNQPILLVKHPDNIREVSLEDAVALVDWNSLNSVKDFYSSLEMKYQQVGDIRDFMAQRAYDLTKDRPNAKETFLNYPGLLKGKNTFEARRNRRGEVRHKLLSEYARVEDMDKFKARCKDFDIVLPQGGLEKLPAWTSEPFFDELIVPYGGDAITLMDSYHFVRKHPRWYLFTPLKMLQLASHEMIARLARIRKGRNFNATTHLLPGDFDVITRGDTPSEGKRIAERNLPDFKQVLIQYGFTERDGLYWTGALPANYANLIASEGKPGPVAPLNVQGQITGNPSAPMTHRPTTRSGTGNLPVPQNTSLSGLAGSSTTPAGRQSARTTQGGQTPAITSGPSTTPQLFQPIPIRTISQTEDGKVPMRPRSTGIAQGSLIQLTTSGEARPKIGSVEWVNQMRENPVDLSVLDNKRPRPPTVTPGPDATVTSPPPVLPAKKSKISQLFYGIEVGKQYANWGVRVASPSGAAPAIRSLDSDTSPNMPNPIPNPGPALEFAWQMVQKYVKQMNFGQNEPLVNRDDVKRYNDFGAEVMADALSLLARRMPGRYPSAYLFMAEKGISMHLEGLERIAVQYEDPMKNLEDLVKRWEAEFGGTGYWMATLTIRLKTSPVPTLCRRS